MSATMLVRITVLDCWDAVTLETSATEAVAAVKRRALEATQVAGAADNYVMKYLGAELRHESGSLAEAGVVPNGALIVMRRRRQPTR